MITISLSNRSINALNFHSALYQFAVAFGHVFSIIYLYTAGVSIPLIFLVWGGYFIIRLIFRPSLLQMSLKLGLRRSLILSTAATAISYIILGMVSGANVWLWIYMVYASLTDTLYWLLYHTCFTVHGDYDLRGKQTAIRNALIYGGRLLAPVIGGFLINSMGFWSAFIGATCFTLISVIPLLRMDDIQMKERLSLREAISSVQHDGFWLFIGDSIFNFYTYIWTLVLFLLLDDIIVFGGLLSLAVLFQILGTLIIGHHFDRGKWRLFFSVGLIAVAVALLGRTFIVETIAAVIVTDLIFMFGDTLYVPILHSAFYNTAKKSHHALWYQLFAESGWDVGGIILSFITAAWTFSGGDLRLAILPCLLGLFVIRWFIFLYKVFIFAMMFDCFFVPNETTHCK